MKQSTTIPCVYFIKYTADNNNSENLSNIIAGGGLKINIMDWVWITWWWPQGEYYRLSLNYNEQLLDAKMQYQFQFNKELQLWKSGMSPQN